MWLWIKGEIYIHYQSLPLATSFKSYSLWNCFFLAFSIRYASIDEFKYICWCRNMYSKSKMGDIWLRTVGGTITIIWSVCFYLMSIWAPIGVNWSIMFHNGLKNLVLCNQGSHLSWKTWKLCFRSEKNKKNVQLSFSFVFLLSLFPIISPLSAL